MHVSTRYRIRDNCDQQRAARRARREAAKRPNLGAIATEMRRLFHGWHEADNADNGLAIAECGTLVWSARTSEEFATLEKHGLTPVDYDMLLRQRLSGKAAYQADFASGAY